MFKFKQLLSSNNIGILCNIKKKEHYKQINQIDLLLGFIVFKLCNYYYDLGSSPVGINNLVCILLSCLGHLFSFKVFDCEMKVIPETRGAY
jgi:hypothetical protein